MGILNIVCLFLVALTACQSHLAVEFSSAKLPFGDYCPRLHYDGDDSIYIFGGCYFSTQRRILKYSLERDTIASFGSLPTDFEFGSVQSDSSGNLFLFGANDAGNQVIKYEVETNTTSIVATLPWDIYIYPTIQSCDLSRAPNTIFIFGGYDEMDRYKILLFDLENYNVTQSTTTLPINLFASAVICASGRAFVFPYSDNGNNNIWEFDFSSQMLSQLEQSDLPQLTRVPSTMSINSSIFVIAGFQLNQTPAVESQEGLLRFDTTTNKTEFVSVENWPVKDGDEYFYYAPQCLYVHKLVRIYCFGGRPSNMYGNGTRIDDEIFYIGMSNYNMTTSPPETTTEMSSTSLNPDWFSCTNKTDDFYPNPTDCARFIGCRGGEMDHFECSPPNLFNPVTRTCDIPQNVDCSITCLDQPNGYYPHPHDCALYIVCREEVLNLVKCPPPLLFDPVMLLCNYPENVVCRGD